MSFQKYTYAIGQTVLRIIWFLCDYFGAEQLGNKQPSCNTVKPAEMTVVLAKFFFTIISFWLICLLVPVPQFPASAYLLLALGIDLN